MITITRRQARRLHVVFRRHPLGIAHKGAVPPLVLRADPDAGLRIRHHLPALAIECLLRGNFRPEETLCVPLDALADFEGRDDTPVVLEAADSGRTVARWDDRGIPQAKEYPAVDLAGLPPFPDAPPAFEPTAIGLLDALAEASATTDEGCTRYALGCIQLKGTTGEVVATDGRQILAQGGFRLPWDGDVLVRRTPLFASRGLPRDRPVAVGRTDNHVAIRAGEWTAWLGIRPDGRFPRVDQVLPADRGSATQLRLDPKDAEFLHHALARLPGGEAPNAPVTLDLNGRVAVRARDGADGRVTELVLGRSRYVGDPVRLNTSRHFLARALGFGFAEVQVLGPDDPVACRDNLRSYLWQPLSKESAIAPDDGATRIESTSPGPAHAPADNPEDAITMRREEPRGLPESARPPLREGVVIAGPTKDPAGGTMAALIQEAVEIHEALADAKARAQRLVGALRRHRKQSRLTSATLAALRQLRLQEAVE